MLWLFFYYKSLLITYPFHIFVTLFSYRGKNMDKIDLVAQMSKERALEARKDKDGDLYN